MTPLTVTPDEPEVEYPQSDGKPMCESTKQYDWIVKLTENLRVLFADREDVFVCADQFWYPVKGHPEIVQAPDPYVVFGRPKKDRPSWKQWEEDDVPLTVVFEVLSPSNTPQEMIDKFHFYDDYGVEEYYVYDPEKNDLDVYVRRTATLVQVRPSHGFMSPRLKIRFDLSRSEMVVFFPDGTPFLTAEERDRRRRDEKQRADDEKQRADDEKQRADDEKQRADDEKQRADDEKQRADKAAQDAADQKRRADKLVELGRKARRSLASTEELAELEKLENEQLAP